ncbi:response regulator [Humisphaera borealis]|uniref:Response regulator n=1 Tax=Humisphaera borealis TaxID=2807512 RepID=A0A7M2WRI0_9BACT|nr:response regulator [Humisphaera borealis]QOV88118.1 response regulator [Humisphaera borealis]
MRAIVIDDSRAMRAILRQALIPRGFEVIEAANGKEALTRLASAGPVDLALVDWNMPEMNGYEFVKAIRLDGTRADMRIMMVTTETEISQMVKALEAGANEYVMKPFTADVITEKLALLGIDCAEAA